MTLVQASTIALAILIFATFSCDVWAERYDTRPRSKALSQHQHQHQYQWHNGAGKSLDAFHLVLPLGAGHVAIEGRYPGTSSEESTARNLSLCLCLCLWGGGKG